MAIFRGMRGMGSYRGQVWIYEPQTQMYYSQSEPGWKLFHLTGDAPAQPWSTWQDQLMGGIVYGDPNTDQAGPVAQPTLAEQYRASIMANAQTQQLVWDRLAQVANWAPDVLAGYEAGYGKFPSDPQAQFDWMLRVMTGGAMEANRQDLIDESSGWEGFMNNAFPVIAAGSLITAGMIPAWAAATGAPAYGPISMASDIINDTTATSGATITPGGGIDSGPYEDAAGNLYNPSPESLPTDYGAALNVTVPPVTDWENQLATSWEQAQAETANQNAALAEASGQVPPGTLASVIGNDAAAGYIADAKDLIAAGNPVVGGVTGGAPVPGGGSTTTGSGITFTDVVKGAGATIPVISAGAGLVRTLTASDGTPIYYGSQGGGIDLPDNSKTTTLASAIPWGLLVAAAIAITGN